MSWQALRWGPLQRVGGASQKAVLWELCNHANEDANHMAWPSLAGLAAKCCMSDSAVRNAIKGLVERGLVEIHGSTIRRRYRLMLENGVQPPAHCADKQRNRADKQRDPADKQRDPADKQHLTYQDTFKNPVGADASAEGSANGHHEGKQDGNGGHDGAAAQQHDAGRPTRLAADWQPSPKDIDWATTNRPTVDWREEAEKFRNHWRAKAGEDALKTSWPLTWRNWIMNAAKFDRRRGAAGGGGSGGNGGGGGWKNAAAMAEVVGEEPWELRLKGYAARGFWHRNWGDRPGSAHCRAPAELLQRYGIANAAA